MKFLIESIDIYIIPPVLSFISGWALALISVIKGKFRTENILFSLVCIWWTLMPLIFILHHFLSGNTETIMQVERSVHTIYVYMPAILFLYLHKAFGMGRRPFLVLSFIVSIIISLFVHTEYYFSGLYHYSWGYSAKGDIFLTVFGLDASCHLLYSVWFFIKKIRTSSNKTDILKLKYILFSFIAASFLMFLNLPALNGIDFYPFGNFMFIPLCLIAYGVLRYRLMQIKSVLHITLIWAITSSLIIIPNVALYLMLNPILRRSEAISSFIILALWFFTNHTYFKKIKPLIDRLFNRYRFNLRIIENNFMDSISELKTLNELIYLFSLIMKGKLYFGNMDFYIKKDNANEYINTSGSKFTIDFKVKDWFTKSNHLVELDMVKSNPDYSKIRESLESLFLQMNAAFIIPFVRNNELTGIAFLEERKNLRAISREEVKFINRIRTPLAISISNSLMYTDLQELKDSLEDKVASRTEELLISMERIESVNQEITQANQELREARRIADMDMIMAQNVQRSLLPQSSPHTRCWDIAVAFKPMSGVSGDLYDFYLEDDKLRGLTLFDVSGHGIASGLITMIARSVLYRNFYLHRDNELGKIMEKANSELINEIDNSDKYLTGLMLRFETDTIEYVNAGHPDMLFKSGLDGSTSAVTSPDPEFKGTILGSSSIKMPYGTLKIPVSTGDLFVLFSDGIIEGTNSSNERFGFKGLTDSLEKSEATDAEGVLKQITDDFYAFTGDEKLKDDLTIVVIRRK